MLPTKLATANYTRVEAGTLRIPGHASRVWRASLLFRNGTRRPDPEGILVLRVCKACLESCAGTQRPKVLRVHVSGGVDKAGEFTGPEEGRSSPHLSSYRNLNMKRALPFLDSFYKLLSFAFFSNSKRYKRKQSLLIRNFFRIHLL